MQKLRQKDRLIIVLHEIYGINQHIQDYCIRLKECGFEVLCPNLLDRDEPFEYAEEERAYQYFMEQVGFARALEKLKALLSKVKNEYTKIYLIGFSVGATTAWLCNEQECLDGIVGYYGSRIRNYRDKKQLAPVMLFLPQEEPAFDVNEFISSLDKRNIMIHKFSGRHGFGDPYHSHHHSESAREAFEKVLEFIRGIESHLKYS
ncbi:dienelactone hydrolase family protein [Mesobacillus foraminis]|uniref:Dienelactone hydrolase n=1 Tax=Mesobacillus foraminis TaxID=279826 RepID=A0A4R2BGN4_9BACI|nr:dienelactone hydrolase family protein [Mesobacillus foraminis]TCN26208.1 dienelactone hydrolase [Mesobacillus foraminis]